MPFLDWVNKAKAQRATADVPYHLLEFQSDHADGEITENLMDCALQSEDIAPRQSGIVQAALDAFRAGRAQDGKTPTANSSNSRES
jgi:hypothetical protein